MASGRCKSIVTEELNNLGLKYKSVELGEVELCGTISNEELELISNSLKKSGLELMIGKKIVLINRIKEAVKQMILSTDDLNRPNFSKYIGSKVNYDYNYLCKIFSQIEGITIEKYFIQQRIISVKEMLVQDNMSLSDIAYQMHYSSVAHLSNQFKTITGLTPFNFRQQNERDSDQTFNA